MNDSEAIISRDNAKLKLARSVRDGRERSMLFIEGVRLLEEALRSDVEIELILVSSPLAANPKLSELLASKRAITVEVASSAFDSIADTENSQGIIALGQRPASSLDDVGEGHTVLLHKVGNPSNLGAVVRNAEAAGIAGLITTNGSADAFSPKALRSSMGSSFRLPIVEKTDLDEALDWARSRHLIPTAADVSGDRSYTEVDWSVRRLLIFGSEAHGLDERELAGMDEIVLIPMANGVESLNLAVSSGIILFEATRGSLT